jgi:hypothetical protein
MSPRLGSLCHSPLYSTKGKFYKSYIKENWTVQLNFHIYVESQVLQYFIGFIILQRERNIKKNYATCAK